MMIQEFAALTKYEPTYEEYTAEIEPIYTEFDGDKYEFCKAWSKFFKHKIKNQQIVKQAPVILQMVCDTDFGYAVNEKMWSLASIGLKLLANIDKGYIDVTDTEGGMCHGIKYIIGDEGWHVMTTTYGRVEFDENAAKRAIKYIVTSGKIKSAYEYAKKVRKGKKIA